MSEETNEQINNPFEYDAPPNYGVKRLQAIDAGSRLEMVKRFDADQLRAAIALEGVQKTVRVAAERRLKKLEG